MTKYSFKITSRVLFCCGFKLARGTNLIVQGSSYRQRDIFFFVFVFVFFFYRKPNFVHSMIFKVVSVLADAFIRKLFSSAFVLISVRLWRFFLLH